MYDKKAMFHHYEHKYHLLKDGVKYIVRAHRKKLNISLVDVGQMKRPVNASQNLRLLIIKQRDVLNHTFHKDAYICNELFQNDNRLPLKKGEKHLQQPTLVLSGVENKVSMQEVAKVKEKRKK